MHSGKEFFKKFLPAHWPPDWWPQFEGAIWILLAGRALLQFGTGFVLFYAPIYFVNQVGLTATAVGAAVGAGQLSGIAGRIAGGSLSDSPGWGRRKTLMASAIVSAIADVALWAAGDFAWLTIANLLLGLGVGLYWPAMEAMVVDLTPPDRRREAFALTRLGDSLGLGLGVLLGGALVSATGAYRSLFVIDGISFLVFWAVIAAAVPETRDPDGKTASTLSGWLQALRDRALWLFVAINTLFTAYLSQIQSTLPLYFKNVAPGADGSGFSETAISGLFAWHVTLAALLQLPVARWLGRYTHVQALSLAALGFAAGFVGIWAAGGLAGSALLVAIAGLGAFTLGMTAYLPSASTLVADMAPEALRGTYLSVNSLCWAFGYALGPPLGGVALDASTAAARGFWLVLAASALGAIALLQGLPRWLAGRSA